MPKWFYGFEKVVFPLATKLIGRFLEHPPTLQYPPEMIFEFLKRHAAEVEVTPIPKGKWILQYGMKYPAALTPAVPYRFVAHKP